MSQISEADLIRIRKAIRDISGRTFKARTVAEAIDESPQYVGTRLEVLHRRGIIEPVTRSTPYRWRLAVDDAGEEAPNGVVHV